MAFAPDLHVFPGGAVDADDTDLGLVRRSRLDPTDAAVALGGDLGPDAAHAAFVAGIREVFEETGVLLGATSADAASISKSRSALLAGTRSFAAIADDLDLRLGTDELVPLSRWVTPPTLPRRFDARFFVADVPEGGDATFEGGEVVGHQWLRPADALLAMATGGMRMWLPTTTTLQQLEYVTSIDEVRTRLSPRRIESVEVESVASGVTRIRMPAGGGIAGQPVWAYLIGRERFVLVDPGDPTGPALDAALARVAAAGGRLEAVLLTHVDPDHGAGTEAIAERAGAPAFVGPGGGAPLPYDATELGDSEPITAGDVTLRAIATPGPRPDHVAFVPADGAFAIAGDLDGIRGARSILMAPDTEALTASRERLAALVPAGRWLGGHPVAASADPT